VPVGIGGTERAMPVGSKVLHRVPVVMIIGEPIHPPAPTGSGRVPRRAVRELTAELHQALQKLFDEARAQAGED
jgi:hypothetical protein